jgi:hypothetical protein
VCARVCGIVLRRRGLAVVGEEERLCVGVHSLARVQERQVSPICSMFRRSRFMR